MPNEEIEKKSPVQYTPCLTNKAMLVLREAEALNVCRSRGVEAAARVMIREIEHSGSAVHLCKNPRHHEGKCECLCGYKWIRFHGEG